MLWETSSARPGALPGQEARLVAFLFSFENRGGETRGKLVAPPSPPPLAELCKTVWLSHKEIWAGTSVTSQNSVLKMMIS